jgi:hypothetical protein
VIEINANSMREFFSDIVAVIPCKEGVSVSFLAKPYFTIDLVLAFSAPKYKTVHENCGGEATTTLYSIQDIIKIVVRCAVGYLLN